MKEKSYTRWSEGGRRTQPKLKKQPNVAKKYFLNKKNYLEKYNKYNFNLQKINSIVFLLSLH